MDHLELRVKGLDKQIASDMKNQQVNGKSLFQFQIGFFHTTKEITERDQNSDTPKEKE
jgi:hypothetical protein